MLGQANDSSVSVTETPCIGEDQERIALNIGHGDLELVEIAAQILQPDQALAVVSKVDRVQNAGIELRTHF